MDEVSTKLIVIFQNVNEWLKFAEAKNGILLAFSGAGLTATITLLATDKNIPNSLKLALLLATFLLCICALICSLSFIPQTDLKRLLWLQTRPSKKSVPQPQDTDNLYYFGDLRKYNAKELIEAINNQYFEGKITPLYKKEYEDIAGQITINSSIAFSKYQIFKYAVYVLILAILVIPVSVMVSLVVYRSL